MKLAGPALFGTYGVADYAEDSSPESKEFARLYRAVAKAPPDNQSSWTYDAVGVLCMAINKAGKTDPDGDPRSDSRRRASIQGAEGEYNFDANRRRAARLQHRARTKRARSSSTSTSNRLT